MRFLAAVLLLTAIGGCDDDVHERHYLHYWTLETGENSYYTDVPPEEPVAALLIRTQVEWDTFWQAHMSGYVPLPPTPALDFSSQTVVAVVGGPQPTLGYSIVIRWIVERDGILHIDVLEAYNGSPLAQTSNPFHIVVIDQIGFVNVRIAEYTFQPPQPVP